MEAEGPGENRSVGGSGVPLPSPLRECCSFLQLSAAMAPGLRLAYPWGRDVRRGTPVVVTMENPNYSVVEIDGPEAEALQAGVPPMDKRIVPCQLPYMHVN